MVQIKFILKISPIKPNSHILKVNFFWYIFTSFPNLLPECSGPLGIEGGIISNQQITASSTHRALFGLQKWYPYYARLNKKGLINAWTAAENDRWPWIQVTHGIGQGECQGMTRIISERIQVRAPSVTSLFMVRGQDDLVESKLGIKSETVGYLYIDWKVH